MDSVSTAVGVTVIVKTAFAPLASVVRLQVTVPNASAHPPEAETNVTLNGRVSVTPTFVAVSGPKLCTVIVYVRLFPTVTGSCESALVMPKSADGVGVGVFVGVLVGVFVGVSVGVAVGVAVGMGGHAPPVGAVRNGVKVTTKSGSVMLSPVPGPPTL